MDSPHDLLPILPPKDHQEEPYYFYKNVVLPLLKDVQRIQANGIPIDVQRTEKLKQELDGILASVDERLAANPLVKQFQILRGKRAYQDYKDELFSKFKDYTHYLKEFSIKNTNHRNYLCNYLLNDYPDHRKDKWTIKDINTNPILANHPTIQLLLNKSLTSDHPDAINTMIFLASCKAYLVNSQYHHKIANPPDNLLDPFNPGSSKQKSEFFEWLGIESEATSKTTGLPSWDKDQVKRVNKSTEDDNLQEVTQAMINYSQAAIIRKNFVAAFDKYVIDNTLYGKYKLFGTKTMRLTSNAPNLLNLPSTGSVFAKPVKKCFIAPKGTIILAADLSALENRVIANLSGDTTLSNIYLEGLDG